MKTVLALSGGLDSTTLLLYLLNMGHEVFPLSFQYGSKHNSYERKAVSKVYRALASNKQVYTPAVLDLFPVFANLPINSTLLLSGEDVPEGHYEEESMRKTVVPGRNLIFASILASYAEAVGADIVSLGVHAGDHHIYPDCRPYFIGSLNQTILASTDRKVYVFAPFLDNTKEMIVKIGLEMGVPFELTRTCYKDQEIACGKCGSCQERLEAFALNNARDPLEYEIRELLPKT
jgi:7-cyano-7-deazaguanine synthase